MPAEAITHDNVDKIRNLDYNLGTEGSTQVGFAKIRCAIEQEEGHGITAIVPETSDFSPENKHVDDSDAPSPDKSPARIPQPAAVMHQFVTGELYDIDMQTGYPHIYSQCQDNEEPYQQQ